MAPVVPGQPVVLASAALEGEEGVVRVWDVETGQQLATLPRQPRPNTNGGRPGLVIRRRAPASAKSTSPIAWGDGRLRHLGRRLGACTDDGVSGR